MGNGTDVGSRSPEERGKWGTAPTNAVQDRVQVRVLRVGPGAWDTLPGGSWSGRFAVGIARAQLNLDRLVPIGRLRIGCSECQIASECCLASGFFVSTNNFVHSVDNFAEQNDAHQGPVTLFQWLDCMCGAPLASCGCRVKFFIKFCRIRIGRMHKFSLDCYQTYWLPPGTSWLSSFPYMVYCKELRPISLFLKDTSWTDVSVS
jgi:hypothetical protein